MTTRVYPTLTTWAEAVARAVVDTLDRAAAARGVASLALAGGNTPRAVYAFLAASLNQEVPWDRVHLFWGDERYVPQDDPRSNYRMVLETLLRRVPVPPGNVHPMPTHLRDANRVAEAYEATLRSFFSDAGPTFDLVLLGLGTDCHTASLFPHSPALDEQRRWVVAAPGPEVTRLTLTYPVINRARRVFFLVTGAEKAESVARALGEKTSWHDCPARGIQPVTGRVTWWLDQAAARILDRGQPQGEVP